MKKKLTRTAIVALMVAAICGTILGVRSNQSRVSAAEREDINMEEHTSVPVQTTTATEENAIVEPIAPIEPIAPVTHPSDIEEQPVEETNVLVEDKDIEVVPEDIADEDDIVEPETDVEEETENTVIDNEHYECSHVWREEYIPATETEEGMIYVTCLRCEEFRFIETLPCVEK